MREDKVSEPVYWITASQLRAIEQASSDMILYGYSQSFKMRNAVRDQIVSQLLPVDFLNQNAQKESSTQDITGEKLP